MKLKAADLRLSRHDPEIAKKIQRNPVYLILDNVLDTYNVGAIFRLADATAVEKIVLCGATETPPNSRIKKASINTTEWVPWEYAVDAPTAIENLKSKIENLQVIAIEQHEKSVPYATFDYQFPVALVVGHETVGVSQSTLNACDAIVEIPMWGVNVSLNVMVSLGIVLYKVMEKQTPL